MDETTKQILLNQKTIMRIIEVNIGRIIMNPALELTLHEQIKRTDRLIYPPSLKESKALSKERDALMGNDAKEVKDE